MQVTRRKNRRPLRGLAVALILAAAAVVFLLGYQPRVRAGEGRVLSEVEMAAIFGDAPGKLVNWCQKSIQCNQGFVQSDGQGGTICYRCGNAAGAGRKICCLVTQLPQPACDPTPSATAACPNTTYQQAATAPNDCPANCAGYTDSGNPCGIFDAKGGDACT